MEAASKKLKISDMFSLNVASAEVGNIEQFKKAFTQAMGTVPDDPPPATHYDIDGSSCTLPVSQKPSPLHILKVQDGSMVFTQTADETSFWARMREEIIERPEHAAKMTGIERLAWLDVKRPALSVSLKEIGELYAAKTGLSSNEAGRSRKFWNEFIKATAVATVREIDHESIAKYESKIMAEKLAPKSVLHRYRKVRTIFAYAIKRGKGIEDCRRALDATAMLEIKDHTPLDPKPIMPNQFWAIHGSALKAGDGVYAALLLTALNCAMYGGEVSALKWDEIDLKTGELVSRRPKTGVSRVAIFWPETLKAIKEMPRQNDYLFNTRVRSFTTFSVLDSWRKYRETAELEDLVFSQIRDAAFTVACRVSLDQARVLAGHRLPGASDHYIRRNPGYVAQACKAIRSEFRAS